MGQCFPSPQTSWTPGQVLVWLWGLLFFLYSKCQEISSEPAGAATPTQDRHRVTLAGFSPHCWVTDTCVAACEQYLWWHSCPMVCASWPATLALRMQECAESWAQMPLDRPSNLLGCELQPTALVQAQDKAQPCPTATWPGSEHNSAWFR